MTTPLSQNPGLGIPSASMNTAPEVAPRRRPVLPDLRRTLPPVVVIIGYFLISTTAFWPVSPLSNREFGGGDFIQAVWFLAWVPHALDHGLMNPYFSSAMFVPTGVNLASTAAIPLLGVISAPFGFVFSPLVRANLLVWMAMPLSATAAFVVLRKWHVSSVAAALGGLIYGFSPYMLDQVTAHLNLVLVPLPPFIALTLVSILRRQGSPWRLGIQLGLLLTAQYLISQEILVVVVILTIASLVCVAIRYSADLSERLRAVWRPVCIALAVATVLLAYPVWMMLAGPQHISGSTFPALNPYHNDLFSFVVPGPIEKFSFGMRSIGTRLAAGPGGAEANGYIGAPLLILTGILAWRSRRSARSQLAVVLLVVSALLSLGPHLAVNGRLTGVPLPFLLLDHIPIVDSLLPSRLCFAMGACLAAVIAFGLDDIRRASIRSLRRGNARHGWAGAVFAGVTLAVLIATQLPRWPFVPAPAVALPASVRHAVPAGDPVAITYPYVAVETTNGEITTQPLLWQAEDGFGFRLLGGYSYHPVRTGIDPSILGPSIMRPPELQEFLAGLNPPSAYGPPLLVSPELVSSTRATVSKYHIRLVIVDRSVAGSGEVTELFDDALGPPRVSGGQFSLWADWHGTPRRQVFRDFLVTQMLVPANGSTLSGTTVLDAKANDALPVTKIEFVLTDRSHHSTIVARATLSVIGWVAEWNTAGVPNGTYSLRSVAYDNAGETSQSGAIAVTVKN